MLTANSFKRRDNTKMFLFHRVCVAYHINHIDFHLVCLCDCGGVGV